MADNPENPMTRERCFQELVELRRSYDSASNEEERQRARSAIYNLLDGFARSAETPADAAWARLEMASFMPVARPEPPSAGGQGGHRPWFRRQRQGNPNPDTGDWCSEKGHLRYYADVNERVPVHERRVDPVVFKILVGAAVFAGFFLLIFFGSGMKDHFFLFQGSQPPAVQVQSPAPAPATSTQPAPQPAPQAAGNINLPPDQAAEQSALTQQVLQGLIDVTKALAAQKAASGQVTRPPVPPAATPSAEALKVLGYNQHDACEKYLLLGKHLDDGGNLCPQ